MTVDRQAYIPAHPILWPRMLLSRGNRGGHLPFSRPDTKYFHFARNAIWLLARAMALEGGKILAPAYHHGVEVEALIDAGVAVEFYRVGRRWEIDLDDVAGKMDPTVRALYMIHYAGFPGPVREMKALADARGIPLIEDCALSLLSSAGGVPVGSTGDASIFSLNKTLPVPSGGALILNGPPRWEIGEPRPAPILSTASHLLSDLLRNLELRSTAMGRQVRRGMLGIGRSAVRAARLRRVAAGTDHFDRDHVGLGMSALARRIVRSQDLPAIVAARRRNYRILENGIGDAAQPLFHDLPRGICPLFYPLVVEDKAKVIVRLAGRGIETINFWRYFHPACPAERFPDTAWLRSRIVEVPCHQDLTAGMARHVAEEVRAVLRGW